MLRQTLNVFTEPVPIQSLYRIDKPRMERASPRPQQPIVGHFVGERVRERVFNVRIKSDRKSVV